MREGEEVSNPLVNAYYESVNTETTTHKSSYCIISAVCLKARLPLRNNFYVLADKIIPP